MKTIKIMILALCLLVPAGFAAAGTEGEEKFEINPYIGMTFPNEDIDNAFLLGLRVGYGFKKGWGAEAEFNWASSEVDVAGNPDVDISHLRVSGLYNFRNVHDRVTPYAKLGIGFMFLDMEGFDNENDFAVNLGGGLRWRPTSSEVWALRFEGQGVWGDDVDTFELSAGFSWFPGQ